MVVGEDNLPIHHFPPEADPLSIELDVAIEGLHLLQGIVESKHGPVEELSTQRLYLPD
jgi:hypothetical protein